MLQHHTSATESKLLSIPEGMQIAAMVDVRRFTHSVACSAHLQRRWEGVGPRRDVLHDPRVTRAAARRGAVKGLHGHACAAEAGEDTQRPQESDVLGHHAGRHRRCKESEQQRCVIIKQQRLLWPCGWYPVTSRQEMRQQDGQTDPSPCLPSYGGHLERIGPLCSRLLLQHHPPLPLSHVLMRA
jgi:hypothetical protein